MSIQLARFIPYPSFVYAAKKAPAESNIKMKESLVS